MSPKLTEEPRHSLDAELRRLLLVGTDPAAVEQVELALPSTDVVFEPDPMGALVHIGSGTFQALAVTVTSTDTQARAILRACRRVGPELFIVLLVQPWDEPLAREMVATTHHADDYIVLPIHASELVASVKPVRRFVASAAPAPSAPAETIDTAAETPTNGSAWQKRISREVAELIHVANLGLQPLLERICWSAAFLFNADFTRIEAEQHQAQTGAADATVNFDADLLEGGKHIGKIQMHVPDPAAVDEAAVGNYLQFLPGLVRLAGAKGQLQELANTDPVTGLANRRHMMQVLEDLVARAKDQRFRVTVVLFDFDNFKQYNDSCGHPAGDEILRESAMLIRRCIRRQDLAVRFGGDEFAVILWDAQSPRAPGSEHPRSVMAVMDRFRRMLRQHRFPKLGSKGQGGLTISGGLATFPWDAGGPDELVEKADQALLAAKQSGKNRVYLVGQGPENIK